MPTGRRNQGLDEDEGNSGGEKSTGRRKTVGVSSALVGVVLVLRLIVFFVHLNHHSTTPAAVAVSFPDPFATPTLPYGPVGIPSLDGTDFPSVVPSIPSDAPTVSPLGPVTYLVTGDGKAAYLYYTVTDTGLPKQIDHPILPFRKTIKGGFTTYFTIDAGAGSGTSITCEIIAKNGKVETRQTARGKHAKVSCEWEPPL